MRSFFFFGSLLFCGAVLVLAASDLYFFWLGMEVMSLSFIGLLGANGSQENSPFYFLPNAAASICFLIGGLGGSPLLLSLGLLVKVGAAPFHFWVPPAMKGLDWCCLWVFMGPMKLAPVVGLGSVHLDWHIVLILVMGALWASVVGAAQECSYGLIAYVSIVSGGWLGMVASLPDSPAVLYWLLFTISSFVFLISAGSGVGFLGVMAGLGLAGLPPGPMFLGKWAVYQFALAWLGVPLAFCLATTAIFSFCMLLVLAVYKSLSSAKMDSSDVGLVVLAWMLFCFLYCFWWW